MRNTVFPALAVTSEHPILFLLQKYVETYIETLSTFGTLFATFFQMEQNKIIN